MIGLELLVLSMALQWMQRDFSSHFGRGSVRAQIRDEFELRGQGVTETRQNADSAGSSYLLKSHNARNIIPRRLFSEKYLVIYFLFNELHQKT